MTHSKKQFRIAHTELFYVRASSEQDGSFLPPSHGAAGALRAIMGCRTCTDQKGVMLVDSVLTWTLTASLLLTSGSWQREISDFSEMCNMAILQLPGADSSSGGQVHVSDSPGEAGKRRGVVLCHTVVLSTEAVLS